MMIGQLGWEKIDQTGFSNIWRLCLGKESTESVQSLTVFNKDMGMLRKEGLFCSKSMGKNLSEI